MTITIAALNIYPIKSCGGYSVDQTLALTSGLDGDRLFMVVDAATGLFVTQRQWPQMARITTRYRLDHVQVRAPGMLRLDLPIDVAGPPITVTVWRDTLQAFDMGPVAAQWFSDFLQRDLRLVRFDPDQVRLSAGDWPGGSQVAHQFADGFPLLVLSRASMNDINQRLTALGEEQLSINRFRANIVLDGLDAFEEDYLDTLQFGDVLVQLTRPCPRCEVPNTDQTTAVRGDQPMRMLASYRAKPAQQGAICVGMNAYFSAGLEQTLAVGQTGLAKLAF